MASSSFLLKWNWNYLKSKLYVISHYVVILLTFSYQKNKWDWRLLNEHTEIIGVSQDLLENFFHPVCDFAQLFRYNVSNPLQVGRISLIDGQTNDLGHFVRMIRPAGGNHLGDYLSHSFITCDALPVPEEDVFRFYFCLVVCWYIKTNKLLT